MENVQQLAQRDAAQSPPPIVSGGNGGQPDSYLGNRTIQIGTRRTWAEIPPELQRPTRMTLVRASHFKSEGREQRIARSLEALDGPNPIQLNAAVWRWLAEDPDIEDIGRL